MIEQALCELFFDWLNIPFIKVGADQPNATVDVEADATWCQDEET
jgi:hypothetical protein